MDDRVFLIAGASSGIGAATARLAAERGHDVVLGARSQDKLDALAEEIGGLAVRCDVTDYADVQGLVQAALDAHGRIDVVFANAGFGTARGYTEEADDPEHWRSMVLTNVLGLAYTVRATNAALRESRGHLLVTSSAAARRFLPSLYSATKHAASAIAHGARADYAGTGVRVTSIEPGQVDTPFFDNPADFERMQDADIAAAVLYAVEAPHRVNVADVWLMPTEQPPS
jgi:NADP-dependent 3-hydroxy acid dehydrogenase YdfG